MTRNQLLQNIHDGKYGERYYVRDDEESSRRLRLVLHDLEAYCETRLGAKLPEPLFDKLSHHLQVLAYGAKWSRVIRVLDDSLEQVAPFFDNYPSETSQDPIPMTYAQMVENIKAGKYEAWMPGSTPQGGWDYDAPTGTLDWKYQFAHDLRGYCDTQLGMRLTDYQFDRIFRYVIAECERVNEEPFHDYYTRWVLDAMSRLLGWVRPFALSEAAAHARSRPYVPDNEPAALF